MKKIMLVVLLFALGCGAGAAIPLISPLWDAVQTYVVGETTERDFIHDVVDAAMGKDPVQILWAGSIDNVSGYLLGTIDYHYDGKTEWNPLARVTFVDGILSEVNTAEPDTLINVNDELECIKDCLRLPPGKIASCVEGC